MDWLDKDVIYGIVLVLFGSLTVAGKWYVSLVRFKAALKEYVPIAYDWVKDISEHTETTLDDKLAYALGVLKDMLASEGIKLTEKRSAIAEGMIRSFHVYQKETREAPKE